MKGKIPLYFSRIPNQIDRESPVPLYYQISEAILEAIEDGYLEPETQIPSEENLGQIFGVSKMTVRQALAKLVTDGRLHRKQGSGTFVADKKIERESTILFSFYEDITAKNFSLETRVLEKQTIRGNGRVMENLRLGPKDRVCMIVRLRSTGGVPLTINYGYIPERFCPDLLEEELAEGSLLQFLERKYGIKVQYAVQNIQAVKAGPFEADLLQVNAGDPLLFMERTMFIRGDIPASYYVNFLRGDKYTFSSTIHR